MENVDAEQLLDLALQASQAHDTQKSIGLVKLALEKAPEDVRMWYMLGSLYADMGLYDKSLQHLETALQIDAGYGIARFHLGLLYLTMGDRDKAEQIWQKLEELGESHYLMLFKSGLLCIADDKASEGIDKIKQGIDRNAINEELNQDMESVIANATLALKEQAQKGQSAH
ncbi:MAG: tetratricopeptide repeat protein [Gammaproteobacteria bacterium]|nr:tetratricopeptide repeat protein [Gammaproteobacteria bacterium]MDH5802353.1 tetratricopeptide repeat protein [Gammaproteobacteria bacterium]